MALNTDILVVIPAAGIGSRTGIELPKQFMEIEGRPIISHTIENFLQYKEVIRIVVVTAAEQIELMQHAIDCIPSTLNPERIRLVNGANSRHQSIYFGLQRLSHEGFPLNSIVVVHDGVRPFLNRDTFTQVVAAAQEFNASGLARNLVSTVIGLDDKSMLRETLVRKKYRASEMPQAFKLSVILDAYEKCPESVLIYGTECLEVVSAYGKVKPKVIQTDNTDAWKITYKMDLHTARNVMKAKQTVGIVDGISLASLSSELVKELELSFECVNSDCSTKTTSYLNYVIFHPNTTAHDVIVSSEESSVELQFKPITFVHIIFGAEDNSDLKVLQKQARALAEKNLEKNLIHYYIVADIDISDSIMKKIAKVVKSLLFDANRHISGEILYF